MDITTYGKSLDNPILLNSIRASLAYLNNLVTDQGLHIIYHRLGSILGQNPVDHYEIMTSDNKYDDIFISIYSEKCLFSPPVGYLFACNFILIDNYSDDEEEPEFCDIEPEFVFNDGLEDLTDILKKADSLPLFEKFIYNSTGTNLKDSGFPYSIVESVVNGNLLYTPEKLKKILDSIKPREKYKNIK